VKWFGIYMLIFGLSTAVFYLAGKKGGNRYAEWSALLFGIAWPITLTLLIYNFFLGCFFQGLAVRKSKK